MVGLLRFLFGFTQRNPDGLSLHHGFIQFLLNKMHLFPPVPEAARSEQALSSSHAPTASTPTTPSWPTSSTTGTITAPRPPTPWWSVAACAYARPPGSSGEARRPTTSSTVPSWCSTAPPWPRSSDRGSTAAATKGPRVGVRGAPRRAPGSPTWCTTCGARRTAATACES